ncbi:MAG: hypothetical protein Q8R02_17625 [Hyphomonadaceae bacterium]|nr:hypothetical protein [Hyphomonadaceae bacterium]
MFRQKQFLILGGMLAAVIVGVVVVFYVQWGAPDPLPADAGGRLAFAARWMFVPGLALLAGIGMTANQRFLKSDAIDGERRVESKSFEINLRYNQNTLEQLALAAVAWTGLALALPVEQLGIVARMAVLFGVGRAAFWIGYLYAPWARAFGMGLTAYPSFAALAWLAWDAVR